MWRHVAPGNGLGRPAPTASPVTFSHSEKTVNSEKTVLWSFCAAKGGTGVSVLAAATACALRSNRDVLLVDLADDQPDLLGIEAQGPGVRDWLTAGASVGVEALHNLITPVGDRLSLLSSGARSDVSGVPPQRTMELVDAFRDRAGVVIVDAGVLHAGSFEPAQLVWAASERTTLVVRACYLGLKRAQRLNLAPTDVVEIVEGGRALRTIDIEAVLGQPVSDRVALDPAIARAADAGLLTSRLPRPLRRLSRSFDSPSVKAAA